jgi:hypothetical protein
MTLIGRLMVTRDTKHPDEEIPAMHDIARWRADLQPPEPLV